MREIARFDDGGLWSQADVWFSRYGTLLATAEGFVQRCPRGYFADELAPLLHGEVQDALPQLTQQGRLSRQMVSGRYLYTASDLSVQRRQLTARRSVESLFTVVDASVREVPAEEAKAAILLFYSLLDEPQRRLYAGLESLKLGRGGDRQLADFLDLDPHTVARGRQQLLAQDVEVDRAQSRRRAQARGKKTPEIVDAIEILLEHDTAGDPISGLKWTRKTTEKIAEVLEQIDIPVSANTVSRLLYQMNFSLRVNRKQIATNSSPYRDQQFQHICSLRTRFQRQGLPIISVDSKKREMIGNFKNAGAKWDRSPVAVNDHDFRSDASGGASPTAFMAMAHPITEAPSASASPTTRRLLPPIPSPPGGSGRDCAAMAARPNFWFWPIPAAATVAPPGPGRSDFRLKGAINSASPSPSLTTLPAPPNGIPSSTGCFPRFSKTGRPSLSTATKKC